MGVKSVSKPVLVCVCYSHTKEQVFFREGATADARKGAVDTK